MRETTEYIYLDNDMKQLASLSIESGATERRAYDIAKAFKYTYFPDSTIWLRVFNQ